MSFRTIVDKSEEVVEMLSCNNVSALYPDIYRASANTRDWSVLRVLNSCWVIMPKCFIYIYVPTRKLQKIMCGISDESNGVNYSFLFIILVFLNSNVIISDSCIFIQVLPLKLLLNKLVSLT